MGDLIVMTPTKVSKGSVPSSIRGAEILFFTGVRYYRMTEETMPIAAAPKQRRRAGETGSKVRTTGKAVSASANPYELQA